MSACVRQQNLRFAKRGFSMSSNGKKQAIAISARSELTPPRRSVRSRRYNFFFRSVITRRTVFFLSYLPLQFALCSRRTTFFARLCRRTLYKRFLCSLCERQIRSRSRSCRNQYQTPAALCWFGMKQQNPKFDFGVI